MKRLICILLITFMILPMCGCVASPIKEPLQRALLEHYTEQQNKLTRIGFSRYRSAEKPNERLIDKIMTDEELLAEKNEFAVYRSGLIYDTLSAEEQLIFTALEYAMVNSYDHIFLDTKITGDPNMAERVVEYLSFESPFLEQNVVCSAGVGVAEYIAKPQQLNSFTVMMRCIRISVDNFTPEAWNKKMLALKQAQKIFDSLNTGGTKEQLIQRLYNYVATSIEYSSGKGETRLDGYLYHALITKKTNCDGFSNALALLFSLADIRNIEKSDTLDVQEGHTWNCFELNGKWYNCDATAGDWIPVNCPSLGGGIFFAFPDSFQESEHDHFIRFPECTEFLQIDAPLTVSGSEKEKVYNALVESFRKNNKEWALVIVKDYDEKTVTRQIQRFVNYFGVDLYSTNVELADGKTAVHLYENHVYEIK